MIQFRNYRHIIPVQIRFSDIDRLNHINNACYHNYIELGRVEYFEKILAGHINWDETGFVLARTEMDHLEQVYLRLLEDTARTLGAMRPDLAHLYSTRVEVGVQSGAEGLSLELQSMRILLMGGIAFQTPEAARGQEPSPPQSASMSRRSASASSASNEIVNQAARSCRRRGKVVLVGVVGLQLNRADFYRHEVSFQVSNSYGEREGTGPGSVRANFTEVLRLMAAGQLEVGDLITHRHSFAEAGVAYAALSDPHALGIVLAYGQSESESESVRRASLAHGRPFSFLEVT